MNPRPMSSHRRVDTIRAVSAAPPGAIAVTRPFSPARRLSLRASSRTRPTENFQAQRGVTLFELTLVLVLVGLLSAVAVSGRSTANTDAFADGEALKGALRTARTRAMADVVPWSFTVAGQTGTLARNGVAKSTLSFETAGVGTGTTTFDYRGQPTGTLSYAVPEYSGTPVSVTSVTGFVP